MRRSSESANLVSRTWLLCRSYWINAKQRDTQTERQAAGGCYRLPVQCSQHRPPHNDSNAGSHDQFRPAGVGMLQPGIRTDRAVDVQEPVRLLFCPSESQECTAVTAHQG